ncbi:uncharacterized protein C14orf132, partial [Callorhinchus milii]|uniref:uncharacterized protein C14orf132 n=1 Tax=Callorhinchus milii TaxID=7868 RepID=UPI001C3F7A79
VSWQIPVITGAFLDSPNEECTPDFSVFNSSGAAAGESGAEGEEEPNTTSSDAVWLWIGIIATIGNIVVVGVVYAFTF